MSNATRDLSHDTINGLVVIAAWAAVGVPLLWGVVETIEKALALFH